MEYFRLKSAKKDKKIMQIEKDKREMHEWKTEQHSQKLKTVQ
jgi:hypothetical protein